MKERSGREAKTASVVGERDLEVIPANQSGRAEEGVDEDEGVLIEDRAVSTSVVVEGEDDGVSDESTPNEANVSESHEFDDSGAEEVDDAAVDDVGDVVGFDSKMETSNTRSTGTAGVEGEAGAAVAGDSGMASKFGVKLAEGSRGGRSVEDLGLVGLGLVDVVGLRGVA